MAEKKGRRLDRLRQTENLTPSQQCLADECGPWIASERAEFRHITPELQQWLIRQDAKETADLDYAVGLAVRVRSFFRWTKRCCIGFVAAFSGVYAFGEKLGKLPETMQSAGSAVLQILDMLRKLSGK